MDLLSSNNKSIATPTELKSLLENGLYDEVLSSLDGSNLDSTSMVFQAISNMRGGGRFLVERISELELYSSLTPVMKFIRAYYYYQNNEPAKSCTEFNKLYSSEADVFFDVKEWGSFGCMFEVEKVDSNLRLTFPSISETPVGDIVGDYVMLLSCDMNYFNLYAQMLYESVMLLDNNVILHFHIICPEDQYGSIDAELFENTVITYSAFSYSIGEVQYYAISRFLVLPSIMARYPEKDILILDVDVLVNRKVNDFVDKVRKQKSHVGIVSPYFLGMSEGVGGSGLGFVKFFKKDEPIIDKKYLRHMPWRSVKAGLLMVRNDEKGKAFSSFLSSAILQLYLQRGKDVKWWLDQGVLFSILSQLEKIGMAPSDVSYIPSLSPLELHTRAKAKALGNERMEKSEYLALRLKEMNM
jgi:hypothetical protein